MALMKIARHLNYNVDNGILPVNTAELASLAGSEIGHLMNNNNVESVIITCSGVFMNYGDRTTKYEPSDANARNLTVLNLVKRARGGIA